MFGPINGPMGHGPVGGQTGGNDGVLGAAELLDLKKRQSEETTAPMGMEDHDIGIGDGTFFTVRLREN